VISNGAAYYDIRKNSDEAEHDNGLAIRQPVPPFKHREVFIVRTSSSAPGQRFWNSAYGSEPSWLEWALVSQRLPLMAEIFGPEAHD
jgi:hypothetical protein